MYIAELHSQEEGITLGKYRTKKLGLSLLEQILMVYISISLAIAYFIGNENR